MDCFVGQYRRHHVLRHFIKTENIFNQSDLTFHQDASCHLRSRRVHRPVCRVECRSFRRLGEMRLARVFCSAATTATFPANIATHSSLTPARKHHSTPSSWWQHTVRSSQST